ncbi:MULTISPECIES: crossover junction endodeoxyribonuclease RuvC [Gordonibacter]|uniref:Crossover junction endodeoxyribonuclease RuvC n=1 Tax=Gordonibacter faecis TaxID=3047475 RepID=A0ABT7DM97_9ACTN|nr:MULTISPECIES: crossover junction endodeoxyribonuclease RuvC [unclassified Gordonibacter]MDJ1650669.1 crossover junction endodeoxyribonuclease RuvC [Gordonibacter sp. KGMB12511]
MARTERIILGIDPGLANTGWGVVAQRGSRLSCVAYGCVSTSKDRPLAQRLRKIHEQMAAVIARFEPTCVGIETVWFGANVQSAFATGQARGAALVACAEHDLQVEEFSPSQIKLAVVGTGSAEKDQVQYMVRQLLALEDVPRPDHAADALAAAVCFTTHEGLADARVRAEALERAARQPSGRCGAVGVDARVAAAKGVRS